MKISRKKFIRNSLLSAIGISFAPKIFSLQAGVYQSMTTKPLGQTGIKVTPLGFGASRTQEPSVLKAALEAGMTLLDTGRSYANGQNEIMIGKVLKGMRDRFVIQSKMKVDLDNGKATPGDIRKQMEKSLNESLKALQTEYIDIMLIHGVRDVKTIQNETIRKVLEEMKQKGAIRACGFSSHTNHVNVLQEANKDNFFDVAMVPFNPYGAFKHSQSGWSTSWDQEGLIKALQKAHKNGTGTVAMKTCSGGTYAFNENKEKSYSGAVQWVLSKDFIDTSAVAMANFEEIKHHAERRIG